MMKTTKPVIGKVAAGRAERRRIYPSQAIHADCVDLTLASDRASDLIRDVACATGLFRDLTRASDLARKLTRASDLSNMLASLHANARAIARDRASAYSVSLDCASDRDRAELRELAGVIAFAGPSAGNLDRARILAGASASDLDVALALKHALERTHARALHVDTDLAGDLDVVISRASTLARDLRRGHEFTAAESSQGEEKRAAPLAKQLLKAAPILLPASTRTRYAEEFQSELTELAIAGAGKFRQLTHVTRVIISISRLRADLHAPKRRGAAP
jgi:hypothetical protein